MKFGVNFEEPNIVTDHWIKSNGQNGLQLSHLIVGLDFFFFFFNGIGLDLFVLIVFVQVLICRNGLQLSHFDSWNFVIVPANIKELKYINVIILKILLYEKSVFFRKRNDINYNYNIFTISLKWYFRFHWK